MKQVVVCVLIAVALAVGLASSANAASQAELRQQVKHAQDVLRFFDNHPVLAKTHAGKVAIRTQRWLLRQGRHLITPIWPPHHTLWLCIHSGEGGWHQASHAVGYDGVSLYWGGMQMHADWGYGTSHHASDDSQLTQEWAAEHAYRASNYSSHFLWQQWAADARCFS